MRVVMEVNSEVAVLMAVEVNSEVEEMVVEVVEVNSEVAVMMVVAEMRFEAVVEMNFEVVENFEVVLLMVMVERNL